MSAIEYYNHTTFPAQGSAGSSSAMRSELESIESGFGKLPDLAGNGAKVVVVNSGGTALEAVAGTGTGVPVRATAPTLTTPNLGTPSALVLTNASGTLTNITMVNPALGTPASGVLTNCTGTAAGLTAGTASAVAVGGVTGLGTGVATFLATPSSANLAAAVTDETGSGALVFATSPTLVAPVLGAATATSINGLGITTSTGVFTLSNGKTLSVTGTLTFAGTDGTTLTMPPETSSIGYMNVPQNSKSAAYTTVLTDAGKHILHPAADNNARTFTIDSNANVAYPIGTAITFINEINTVTIAITSDTMVLAGSGATGSRTLAANGMATAIKVTSTKWYISGAGLT